jgi:hypothetical protein
MNMQLGTSKTGLYGDIPGLFMLSACWREMMAANSFATDGFSATDSTVRIDMRGLSGRYVYKTERGFFGLTRMR